MKIAEQIEESPYKGVKDMWIVTAFILGYWLLEVLGFGFPNPVASALLFILFILCANAFQRAFYKVTERSAAVWEGYIQIDMPDRDLITLHKRFVTHLAPQNGMIIDGVVIKLVELTEESDLHARVNCKRVEGESKSSLVGNRLIASLGKRGWNAAYWNEDKAYVKLQIGRYSKQEESF